MAASKVTPGSMTQLIKGDRSMLMMSDDNVMMKQIQGSHNPDGREIDVKPILHIVVDILSRHHASRNQHCPGHGSPRTHGAFREESPTRWCH
ncbi:hypothetical protein CsSME_00004563 [Camellia sinensis var. sinensis]